MKRILFTACALFAWQASADFERICFAWHGTESIPGWHSGDGKCAVVGNDNKKSYNKMISRPFIISDDKNIEWRQVKDLSNVAKNIYDAGGMDANGNKLYVCKFYDKNEEKVYYGKIVKDKDQYVCYYVDNARNVSRSTDYYALVRH